MSNIKFNYGNKEAEPVAEQEQTTKLNNPSKYGNDEIFEAWADANVFAYIGDSLVDPLHCMGLTPNMVTLLSTFFTLLSIYYLHINNRMYASISFLVGYTLDNVDGRMARKYSMGSKLGMVLDCVSDNISVGLLISYILYNRPSTCTRNASLILLSIMLFLLSVSFGLNEAIAAKKQTGDDNFYKKRVKELEGDHGCLEKLLYKIFLFITNSSYKTYKMFFPNYNEEEMFRWLKILKHFGPGHFCLLVSIILLYI
jgi:phosphatidylglycerophosphate synthase